ncbi:VCBS domain-containing protein, partial [Vibrio breoganii]
HFSNTDIKGSLGTLHLTDSGAWTYDLDNSNPAVQALAKGQHAKDIITVHSTDGTPHQVAITVNGANDAAQITGTTTGAVTEDRIYGMQWLVVNSHMNVTDTDAGEAHFDPVLHAQNNAGIGYTSTLGASVVVAPDGDWHYQLDNNIQQVQSLGQGQSYVDKVTVHTVDGTTQELQITITGTNDAPTVTGSRVLPVGTEDQTLRITQTQLVAGATDIDKNDAGTLHVDAVTADHGTVTHNADGSFTFHPDQDYNGKVQFTYDVKDAHGGSVQATASSTLAATADAATISGVDTGDVHEGHTFTAPDGSMTGGYVDDRSPDHMHGNIGKLWNDEIHTDGHLSIVDADAGESYAQTGVYYGSHGRVILQTNGDWSYFASIGQDATGRAIDHLGKGESLTDTVTVKSADGTTHDIVITIHGDNDRPYCSGEVQLNSGKEDLAQTITVSELLANTVDVDTNDIGKLTITNLHADHGSILDNQDGTFTFTPTKDYNGQVHFTYDVQDAHGGVTHTGATTSLSAVGDTAVIGGQDTFTVQEDHNLTLNSGNTIIYNGQLTITDADAGEDHFDSNLHQNQQTGTWDTGYTTQEGGKLILQSNGSYRYEIDNSLVKIQSLGSSETLIDTVTVRSTDGTPHQIQVTIQGDNDAPVVSSAVTLTAGTEDTDVVLHASDLLANATDIDHNDAGKLSVANLIADHGNITDNHDGTFTFHPSQDYNGKVSFTYDVQDAHGGSVATSASITLAPTRDSAVISGDNTGTIIEDHNVGHSSLHPVAASGLLSVTDPDAGQDHFQVNRLLGEQAIHDPFGGFLRITPNGAWGYEVANSRLQSLAEGEVEKVVYRVYSADHTAHDITITVTGTNDRPTITATTLAHGTEDTHYQMQASQFGFNDIDTGDTLHSIAITDLPPATQGKFVLDGHDVTAGQHIPTADISKLQFVPAQDFNGDVQFKYTVNDGHTDSTEASNTLHIDAVGDSAVITGTITGDVDEGHGTYHDRSPNYAQPGMAKLTNDPLYTDGKLEIIDPDTGEAQFDTKGVGYSYHGTYGQLILNADGNWHYKVTVGSNQQNVATQIDQLGDGQQLTDTITVYSKDGTAQDIVITIHGDNDRPYISSEVTLATGTEDTALTFTKADLLANTVDVDANDAGKLSIANLLVDHGSVVDNKDGTYTFTPTKDYNGQVHFSYDVTDAHGGVTHTGATTTLAAVNDAATFSGKDTGSVVEDQHVQGDAQHTVAVSGAVIATDPDAGEGQFVHSRNVQAVSDPFGGNLTIGKAGDWTYSVPNANIQHLAQGEAVDVVYQVRTVGGDTHNITVSVVGTNDQPTITATTLAHGTENTHYQMQASQFGFSDIDTKDTLHSISITGLPSSSEGKFVLGGQDVTTGQAISTADISKLQFVPAHGFSGDVDFKYTVNDGHQDSNEATNTITVDSVNHAPTVAAITDTVSEDQTNHHQLDLLQGATDTDGDTLSITNLHYQVDGGATSTALPAGVSVASDGHTLVVDATHQAFQHLGVNQSETIVVTYNVTDGQGGNAQQTATLTVTGTNDAPVLNVQQASHVTGTLVGTDVEGDTLSYSTPSLSGQYGSLTLDSSTGDYVYTPNSHPQGLTYNASSHTYTGQDTFEVKVSDGHGGEATKYITFGVVASVSGPVVAGGQPSISTSVPNTPSVGNTAPSQPSAGTTSNAVSLELSSTSDTGQKGDLLTSDNTPTVSGHTAQPFSQVEIVENGKVIATTHSDANGDYHTDLPGLTDATHTLVAQATDPLSTNAVQSHPLAVVVDTVATVSVSPISQDNMLTGSEHTHSFNVGGSVTGVEDGQTIQVEIDHSTYQGHVANGKWSVAIPASAASSLSGGVHQVTVSVTDKAGNHATMDSPLFVADGSTTPPIPTIHRPHITGGGGVGSHVTGDLVAPPLLQQLHPQVGSGWGILAPDGSTVTHLHGQYGTLVIDPKTGHVDYQYSSAPTPGQKAAGGTHWAGQTTSEQHHDVFQIMYHDAHSSNVDVKVNLDVTYMHGHSGHNQTSTNLVSMSVTPVTPTVQHDEAAPEPDVIEVTLYADDDNTHHDLMAGLSALADDHSSSGSNPYTDIVGLHDAPQADDSAMPTPEPAPDLDLLLNQADDLAHQHPVDAFIDNNGEEHKADDQHVLDEEHIQHDLPDVMDLPDHHH